jgi:hypothetical protein
VWTVAIAYGGTAGWSSQLGRSGGFFGLWGLAMRPARGKNRSQR